MLFRSPADQDNCLGKAAVRKPFFFFQDPGPAAIRTRIIRKPVGTQCHIHRPSDQAQLIHPHNSPLHREIRKIDSLDPMLFHCKSSIKKLSAVEHPFPLTAPKGNVPSRRLAGLLFKEKILLSFTHCPPGSGFFLLLQSRILLRVRRGFPWILRIIIQLSIVPHAMDVPGLLKDLGTAQDGLPVRLVIGVAKSRACQGGLFDPALFQPLPCTVVLLSRPEGMLRRQLQAQKSLSQPQRGFPRRNSPAPTG